MGSSCSTTGPDAAAGRNHRHSRASRQSRSVVLSTHRQSHGSDGSDSQSGRSMSQNEADVTNSGVVDSPMPDVANGVTVTQRSQPAEPKVPALAELPADLRKLTCGRFDVQPTYDDKIIYVFHCAGLTDVSVELEMLDKRVYPELARLCQEAGCRLELIDFSRHVSSQFDKGGAFLSTCHSWLRTCVQRRLHCIFTVFLTDKYGIYWCPQRIDVEHFKGLLRKVPEYDREFLVSLYRYDSHHQPPCYFLQLDDMGGGTAAGDSNSRGATAAGNHGNVTNNKDMTSEWAKHLIRLRNILLQAAGHEFQKLYFSSWQEELLDEYVYSGKIPKDNVVMLRRSFRKFDVEAVGADYIDVNGDRLNEYAQGRLVSMASRLDETLRSENKIFHDITWHEGGVRLDEKQEHVRYIDNLCTAYTTSLRAIIQAFVAEKHAVDIQRTRCNHRGLTRSLFMELQETNRYIHDVLKVPPERSEFLNDVCRYCREGQVLGKPGSDVTTVRPLIVHGKRGCGKTHALASLAEEYAYFEDWSSAVCIYKVVSLTNVCDTVTKVIHSIAEHLCVLAQTFLQTTPTATTISDLLAKSNAALKVLIIIDGVDEALDADTCDMSWVPLSLPLHVRLVISVTSESTAHHHLKNHIKSVTSFYTLDKIKPADVFKLKTAACAQNKVRLGDDVVMRYMFGHAGRNSFDIAAGDTDDVFITVGSSVPPSLPSTLANRTKSSPNPIKYAMPDVVINPLHAQVYFHTWCLGLKMREVLTTPLTVDATTEAQVARLLEMLEKKYPVLDLHRVCALLSLSRSGLTDYELLDVVNRSHGNQDGSSNNAMFSSVTLTAIKNDLHQFLLETHHSELCCVSLKHRQLFHDVLSQKYGDLLTEMKTPLLAYFSDILTAINSSNVAAVASLPDQRRCLAELPYQLFKNGKFDRLLSDCVISSRWLSQKLAVFSLQEVLFDLDLAIKLASSPHSSSAGAGSKADGLLQLKDKLLSMASQASQGWGTLTSYFHNKKIASSHFSDNFIYASLLADQTITSDGADPVPSLKCISPTADDSAINDNNNAPQLSSQSASARRSVTGIFRIKNDNDHVISVAVEAGEMIVWNVHTCARVRTFRGLNAPRDVKMCGDVRAVVLCQRELHVIDLDTGAHISTLKGVLNIFMPYYGMQGPEHTVALARNRMYLNVISNASGDVIASFKVGEDRFLDSLLVSDNGDVCVCGDAVTKPFPLLSWNLHSRKLMHEMKISGHDFITRISAISSNGHYVACACIELEDPDPNLLIVYDLQTGYVYRRWRRELSITCVAISSMTSLVVCGMEDGTVVIWDLKTGNEKALLRGHIRGPDIIRVNESGTAGVTYDSRGRDVTLWLWDLELGVPIGRYISAAGIVCAELAFDNLTVAVSERGRPDILLLRPPGYSDDFESAAVFGDAARISSVFTMNLAASAS